MSEIILPNNWEPRDDQFPLWEYLQNGGKRAVEVAHRRWGKDDVGLHYTACALHKRIGNYWHMLPKYAQCRKAIWDAINPRTGKKRIDEAFPEEIRKNTNKQEMKIEFKCGSTWQLVGSDNYNQLVGSPPVGLVLSEYALANPLAWAYLRPILLENNGWALFIYTSRGDNHGKVLYYMAESEPSWFAELTPADKSPVFNRDQLKAERNEYILTYGQDLGEALFNQEYFCSFEGAQLGAFYTKQLVVAKREKRITNVPYDPNFEVYTFWDLGVDDSTTIWFMQQVGTDIRWIDYYENCGEGMSHYAKVLKEKDYVYGDHYLPHDGDAKKLGEEAESPRQVLERLNIKPIIIVQRPRDNMAVLRGINAVRSKFNYFWFDERKCQQGLLALQQYHAEYDEGHKKMKDSPAHDWSSHGADAMRTYGAGFKQKVKAKSAYEMLGVA
jgi:hypothetical protein